MAQKSNKYIRICQWNCRSIRGKLSEMERFANEWDIIILIETYLKPSQPAFIVNGFEIVRIDRMNQGGGGIAFLIKRNLIFQRINLNFQHKALETGAVNIQTSFGEILLAACYRSPSGNNNLEQKEWVDFLASIQNINSKFVIGGDLNAHHYASGSNKSCVNGNLIFNNTEMQEYILLNDGSYTCSSGPEVVNSCIDLTFVSPDLALVSAWQVEEDNFRSDHFPITLTLGCYPIYIPRNNYRYKTNKIDWAKFVCEINSHRNTFHSLEFLNSPVCERYQIFMKKLEGAIIQSIQGSTTKHRKHINDTSNDASGQVNDYTRKRNNRNILHVFGVMTHVRKPSELEKQS